MAELWHGDEIHGWYDFFFFFFFPRALRPNAAGFMSAKWPKIRGFLYTFRFWGQHSVLTKTKCCLHYVGDRQFTTANNIVFIFVFDPDVREMGHIFVRNINNVAYKTHVTELA